MDCATGAQVNLGSGGEMYCSIRRADVRDICQEIARRVPPTCHGAV